MESGHLHIQTEFCEGGSLEAKARLNPIFGNLFTNVVFMEVFEGGRVHQFQYEVFRSGTAEDFDTGDYCPCCPSIVAPVFDG